MACAALDNILPRYPKPEERRTAIDAISRIMLHLYATFTNRIEIYSSGLDKQSSMYKCGVQRNLGWFSFTSKLTHSCEPNLLVMGLNNKVALIALRRIKKGEELTISYVEQFYDMKKLITLPKRSLLRQKKILKEIQHLCECRVCVQEWDAHTHVRGTLTPHQQKTFDEFMNTVGKGGGSTGNNLKVAATALDVLTGMTNTTQHKAAYDAFRVELNLCQCAVVLNKTYESSSFYGF